jgi:enolase-phosphatase E1
MRASDPRLYLLDVEGTVAPVSFVTEQLFPNARKQFRRFLAEHLKESDIQTDLRLLAEENRRETEKDSPTFGIELTNVEHAIAYLFWLMDRDRKSTALKSLQGKIWKSGFESGELRGELYADVPPALARWSANARVAIYSSGSVEAQQLLFRYSNYGDLTPLISAYFDTRTGAKTASTSYAAIADAMNVSPNEILFFSDVVRELDPAREAGCQTRLVVRPGNVPVTDVNAHLVGESFEAL